MACVTGLFTVVDLNDADDDGSDARQMSHDVELSARLRERSGHGRGD